MRIEKFKSLNKNTEALQKFITNYFTALTDSIPELKEFRDEVEKEVWGFGERCFLSMHKMVVESFKKNDLKFLEIGVYKGQLLALMKILEKLTGKAIDVYGVTPLDSSDGHIESDYEADIKRLHDLFGLEYPVIFHGKSQDNDILEKAKEIAPYDILMIDGSHVYEDVKFDIEHYSKMVAKGGYLIIDDSANYLEGTYWGAFWGIEPVSKAVDEALPPKAQNNEFEYIGNVVHDRIWQRI